MLILIIKYVSFIKTFLLIIVSRVVINNWNAINKSLAVEKTINVNWYYKRDKWNGIIKKDK